MDERQKFMQVAEENGTRPGSRFYHINDGWHYHLNGTNEDKHYFKCVLYATGCQGRAMFDPENGFIHTQGHNHAPDPVYPDEVALRLAILNRYRHLAYAPCRRFWDEECRRFPPEAVARVTYASMLTSMQISRRQNIPARYLQEHHFPTLNNDVFYIPQRGAQ